MLKPRFERTMQRSYLRLDCDSYTKNFEEDMLQNQIQGILPFHIEYQDEKIVFSYEITQKLSFHEYIKQSTLNYDTICTFLYQIITSIKGARDYLLNPDDFIIHTDYIYVGDEGTSYWLCYYKGYHQPVREQLAKVSEQWMKEIDYGDQKTVKLVYELYQLLSMESCTYDQILGVIDRKKIPQEPMKLPPSSKESESIPKDIVAMEEELLDESEILYYPVRSFILMGIGIAVGVLAMLVALYLGLLKNAYGDIEVSRTLCMILMIVVGEVYVASRVFCKEKRLSRMETEVSYISYQAKDVKQSNGSNVVMQQKEHDSYDKYMNPDHQVSEEEGHTVLLFGEEQTQLLSLHRRMLLKPTEGSYETIEITSEKVIVGSSKKYADIILPYRTVSRKHALIYWSMDSYYLEDLGSTNGTFYCGQRMKAGNKQILNEKDQIQFAEYTYEVKFIKDI